MRYLRRALERFRARVGGPQGKGLTRRSLFGMIPLVPTAAEITAKALAVPAKPSGEILLPAGSKIDIRLTSSDCFIPASFTIPPLSPELRLEIARDTLRYLGRGPFFHGTANAKPISLDFPPGGANPIPIPTGDRVRFSPIPTNDKYRVRAASPEGK
jgi:hypothetical protein